MKNKERYYDEMIDSVVNSESCEFKLKRVFGQPDYDIVCSQFCLDDSCEECAKRTKEWLEEEYTSQVVEIDWGMVPKDTCVLVWDGDNRARAVKRYFCQYSPAMARFGCYKDGRSSFTALANEGLVYWDHAELYYPEEAKMYKKLNSW